jgi:hypothetical protein
MRSWRLRLHDRVTVKGSREAYAGSPTARARHQQAASERNWTQPLKLAQSMGTEGARLSDLTMVGGPRHHPKQPDANGCFWPAPGLRRSRRKLTLVRAAIDPNVGLLASSRTAGAGHKQSPATVRFQSRDLACAVPASPSARRGHAPETPRPLIIGV